MTTKILSVLGIFIVSMFIGFNSLIQTEVIQASPQFISPLELFPQQIKKEIVQSERKVDVDIDLETGKVLLKGNADASVKVINKVKEPKTIRIPYIIVKEVKVREFPHLRIPLPKIIPPKFDNIPLKELKDELKK